MSILQTLFLSFIRGETMRSPSPYPVKNSEKLSGYPGYLPDTKGGSMITTLDNFFDPAPIPHIVDANKMVPHLDSVHQSFRDARTRASILANSGDYDDVRIWKHKTDSKICAVVIF